MSRAGRVLNSDIRILNLSSPDLPAVHPRVTSGVGVGEAGIGRTDDGPHASIDRNAVDRRTVQNVELPDPPSLAPREAGADDLSVHVPAHDDLLGIFLRDALASFQRGQCKDDDDDENQKNCDDRYRRNHKACRCPVIIHQRSVAPVSVKEDCNNKKVLRKKKRIKLPAA